MIKQNQKGFAVIEATLIIVSVLLVVGIGWYVIKVRNDVYKNSPVEEASRNVSSSKNKLSPSSAGSTSSYVSKGNKPTSPPQPPVSSFTKCKGFSFTDSDITANSLDDLKVGILGTWHGCATTPWIPKYDVTFTFNPDGSYSAKSDEYTALYYGGGNQDDPRKKYTIDDFSSSKIGYGSIDVVFLDGSNSVVRDPMNLIKLMDNKLYFEVRHFTYGPLIFQLNRQ